MNYILFHRNNVTIKIQLIQHIFKYYFGTEIESDERSSLFGYRGRSATLSLIEIWGLE